jgi:hypothetical protein
MGMKEKDLYIISQPGIYIFVTKHLGKILFCFFLLMFIVAIAYQEDFEYIKRLFHIVIVLSMIGLIVDRFLRKVAYKIIIDFNESTIDFYMCRSVETKKYSFRLIKTISINKYAIFVLENGKILYNLGQNEEFNRSIDRLKIQAGTISEI